MYVPWHFKYSRVLYYLNPTDVTGNLVLLLFALNLGVSEIQESQDKSAPWKWCVPVKQLSQGGVWGLAQSSPGKANSNFMTQPMGVNLPKIAYKPGDNILPGPEFYQ